MCALADLTPPHVNRAPYDEECAAYIRDLLDSGQPLDVDKAARHLRDVRATLESLLAVERGCQLAMVELGSELDAALRAGQATVYESLSTQLTATIDAARDLSEVADLDTEQVLARDLGDQWKCLNELRRTHRHLRDAQTTLQQRLSFADDPTFPELNRLRNPVEVFGDWRAWRIDGAVVNPADPGDYQVVTPPWPTEVGGNPSRDHDAWFDWLIRTPTAVAWVPFTEQFEREQSSLFDYLREAPARPAKRAR